MQVTEASGAVCGRVRVRWLYDRGSGYGIGPMTNRSRWGGLGAFRAGEGCRIGFKDSSLREPARRAGQTGGGVGAHGRSPKLPTGMPREAAPARHGCRVPPGFPERAEGHAMHCNVFIGCPPVALPPNRASDKRRYGALQNGLEVAEGNPAQRQDAADDPTRGVPQTLISWFGDAPPGRTEGGAEQHGKPDGHDRRKGRGKDARQKAHRNWGRRADRHASEASGRVRPGGWGNAGTASPARQPTEELENVSSLHSVTDRIGRSCLSHGVLMRSRCRLFRAGR